MMPPFTKDGNAQSSFALHLNCHLTRPPPTGPSTANRFRRGEGPKSKVTAQFPSTIRFRLRTSQRWIERPPGGFDGLVELLFEPRRNSSQASHDVLGHSIYSNRRSTDQSAAGLDAMARRLLVCRLI